jgi:hypothetical protein
MKYYKFKKITKGENPIIRVTYKTWHGSLIEKDICKSENVEGFWEFMEDGNLTHRFEPINNFYKNDEDVYWVNGA